MRTVRSFAQEDYEISRYSEKVDETLKLGLKQAVSSVNSYMRVVEVESYNEFLLTYVYLLQKIVGFFFGGLSAASTLSVIVVVIYGATLTIKGSMTPGSLTSFILYSLTGNESSK